MTSKITQNEKAKALIILWIHKRHPVPRPYGRATGRLLGIHWREDPAKAHCITTLHNEWKSESCHNANSGASDWGTAIQNGIPFSKWLFARKLSSVRTRPTFSFDARKLTSVQYPWYIGLSARKFSFHANWLFRKVIRSWVLKQNY